MNCQAYVSRHYGRPGFCQIVHNVKVIRRPGTSKPIKLCSHHRKTFESGKLLLADPIEKKVANVR